MASCFKYLGISFDPNLSWEHHVNSVCTKISQRLGIISRIRNCLPQETAKMLVESVVIPLFDYGDIISSNCSSHCLSRLQRLLNRQIIIKLPIRTSSSEVRSKLNWLTLTERQNLHLCSMVFKCYNGLVPEYLIDIFYSPHPSP